MIPVSVVRFAADAPCVLQAPAEAWDRLIPLLRAGTAKNDAARTAAVAQIRSARTGPPSAQRVTLPPEVARWVLDAAQVG